MKIHTYSDPGHGWAKVPKALIAELNLVVSRHSYMRGEYAYLEEDGDLTAFVDAMTTAKKSVEFVSHHSNSSSRIRSYDSYYNYTAEELKLMQTLRDSILKRHSWSDKARAKITKGSLNLLKYWSDLYLGTKLWDKNN